MIALAFATVLVASRLDVYRNRALYNSCLLICEFVFPFYLLLSIRRTRTGVEIVGIALALAYMCWGGLLLFSPRPPGPYLEIHPFGFLNREEEAIGAVFHPGARSRYREVWWLVRRWNWALLALFYFALLADAVIGRNRAGMTLGHAKELLAIKTYHPARKIINIVTLAGTGMALGLLLSWGNYALTPSLARLDHDPSGSLDEPLIYYAFASCTLAIIVALMGIAFHRRRHRVVLSFLPAVLAIYWGFAVSVQLVETPYVSSPSRIITSASKVRTWTAGPRCYSR